MLAFLRLKVAPNCRLIRAYSQKTLTPSELRFQEKLKEADRKRLKSAPEWEKRDNSLRERYGSWNPTRKLSRQQMDDIRALKARAPELKTVQIADFFKISPEAIRRILNSRWVPSEKEHAEQQARGEKRKAESLQRKLDEKQKRQETGSSEDNKETGFSVTGERPVSAYLKRPGVHNHRKKHYFAKKGPKAAPDYSRSSSRKTKVPFTQGVGDLID